MSENKEIDYDEYSVTKTYSLKLRNVKKVDKVSEENKINKSAAVDKIIEEY